MELQEKIDKQLNVLKAQVVHFRSEVQRLEDTIRRDRIFLEQEQEQLTATLGALLNLRMITESDEEVSDA